VHSPVQILPRKIGADELMQSGQEPTNPPLVAELVPADSADP
jgi:hypothetical protein